MMASYCYLQVDFRRYLCSSTPRPGPSRRTWGATRQAGLGRGLGVALSPLELVVYMARVLVFQAVSSASWPAGFFQFWYCKLLNYYQQPAFIFRIRFCHDPICYLFLEAHRSPFCYIFCEVFSQMRFDVFY